MFLEMLNSIIIIIILGSQIEWQGNFLLFLPGRTTKPMNLRQASIPYPRENQDLWFRTLSIIEADLPESNSLWAQVVGVVDSYICRA